MFELVERLGALVAGDLLPDDFQPLKEALVEQPPFLGAGLHVGALNVLGHGEGQVKGLEHGVMLHVQAVNPLFKVGSLPANTSLLLGKQRLAYLVGVMGLQQLALLLVEAFEPYLALGNLLGG